MNAPHPRIDRRGAGARALLASNAGLAVWALCFLVLYVGLSIGCQLPVAQSDVMGMPVLSLVLSLLWLVHAAWLLWLIARAHHRWRTLAQASTDARFVATLTLLLHAAALLAVIWTGFPVLLLPACM